MFRALAWLIIGVLVIGVLRSVLGIIAKLFSSLVSGPSSPEGAASGPQKPRVPVSESLKKDPVCGMFIAPSTAVRKTVGETTFYFCSPGCRDKFQG